VGEGKNGWDPILATPILPFFTSRLEKDKKRDLSQFFAGFDLFRPLVTTIHNVFS
jgi:hypothetical protein